MTARRAATAAVNAALVLVILGTILATWWPAVYVSDWFQHNRWVRAHVLGDAPATPPAAIRPPVSGPPAVVRSTPMPDRSPFPGMDPWLEASWGDVHHTIISSLRRQVVPACAAPRPVCHLPALRKRSCSSTPNGSGTSTGLGDDVGVFGTGGRDGTCRPRRRGGRRGRAGPT